MNLVSNASSWWLINRWRFLSNFAVTSSAAVIYDWMLTLGQEVELVWRQRWSLMTVLYLSIRYIGILYIVADTLVILPTVPVTDAGCNIMNYATNWTNVATAAMLGVIMLTRLHAMYQRSKKILIFLVVIFLTVNITCGVITGIGLKYIVGKERILSGSYECAFAYEGDVLLLIEINWTLTTVWEVLALFLSVWVAIKHFRDLRRLGPSTGSTMGDIFMVLIKSHALYFASFAAVSSLQLGHYSPYILNSKSVGAEMYYGLLRILMIVQMFVLGPRLILSVREYNAKLMTDSDAGTHMSSIAFQEHVHVASSASV